MFFIWQSKGNNFGSYTKKEAVNLLPDSDFENKLQLPCQDFKRSASCW